MRVAIRAASKGMLLLASGLPLILLPAPSLSDNNCMTAIKAVKDDIDDRLGANIRKIEMIRAESFTGGSQRSPFGDADGIILFTFNTNMGRGTATAAQNRAAYNIMFSPNLTREYAIPIIQNCDQVASVRFFYWSWFAGWSLHPGGQIINDRCVDIGSRNLSWGENKCS